MNPTWAIVIVNTIAVFAVPFFTYRYAHKNNLKILKEKWLSNVRDATSNLVGSCNKLYYANSTRYERANNKDPLLASEMKLLLRRSEDAQAEVTAASVKLRLLFKEGSTVFNPIKDKISEIISSLDNPIHDEGLIRIDSAKWYRTQDEFLKSINILLQTEWESISSN